MIQPIICSPIDPATGKQRDPYPGSEQSGVNWSAPKAGMCAEGATALPVNLTLARSASECTWRRTNVVRLIGGDRLLSSGWIKNYTETDTPTNKSHTKHNVKAFARAFASLDEHFAPRCCGC